MEFKSHLQYLLENKYLVMMASKPIVTIKFEQEAQKVLQEGIKVENKVTVETYLKPSEYTNDQKKKIWNQFIEDADIPHRVKTSTGTYTVRQYGIEAANKLIKLLSEQENTVFIEATKNYYKTVNYPILLSKYLRDDYWVHEVKEFKKKPTQDQIKVGTNRFED